MLTCVLDPLTPVPIIRPDTFEATHFALFTKLNQPSSGSSKGLARIPSIEPHEGDGSPGSPATAQITWKRRPFALTNSHLLYFKGRDHLGRWARGEAGVEPRGSLPLQELGSVEDGDAQADPPESRCAMTVRSKDGTAWVLRSADREEIARWRASLSDAIGMTEEQLATRFPMETFEV